MCKIYFNINLFWSIATCSILHMGEMKFKQRPREEQAEADGSSEAEKVIFFLFRILLVWVTFCI